MDVSWLWRGGKNECEAAVPNPPKRPGCRCSSSLEEKGETCLKGLQTTSDVRGFQGQGLRKPEQLILNTHNSKVTFSLVVLAVHALHYLGLSSPSLSRLTYLSRLIRQELQERGEAETVQCKLTSLPIGSPEISPRHTPEKEGKPSGADGDLNSGLSPGNAQAPLPKQSDCCASCHTQGASTIVGSGMEENLWQKGDTGQTRGIVETLLAADPPRVEESRQGKDVLSQRALNGIARGGSGRSDKHALAVFETGHKKSPHFESQGTALNNRNGSAKLECTSEQEQTSVHGASSSTSNKTNSKHSENSGMAAADEGMILDPRSSQTLASNDQSACRDGNSGDTAGDVQPDSVLPTGSVLELAREAYARERFRLRKVREHPECGSCY